MLDGMKRSARWIICLVVVEAILGAGLCLLKGDATTAPRFYFVLLVLIVNFPGFVVAAKLGLLGQGWLGSGGDPVLACAVSFGFSLLFYSGCIWGAHRALAGRRSEPNPWKIGRGDPRGSSGGEGP